jgi:DNA topoisomerase-1
MARYLVVAEKSSVASSLRRILSGVERSVAVSHVRGHLMDLDLPPRFSRWRLEDLREIFQPHNLRTVVSDHRSYRSLRRLIDDHPGAELVIATDNDPEGELIGYEVLNIYWRLRGSGSEYWRMRFNSLEDEEIKRSWRSLERGLNWGWVYKADFRRGFDLLSGAVFTRLLTLNTRRFATAGVLSWGPVQSPCLNFVVSREKEIRSFRPTKYWYVSCLLRSRDGSFWARSGQFWDRGAAENAYRLAQGASVGTVTSFQSLSAPVARPLPATTDSALRDLARITGRSSYRLMQVLEELYRGGYISYPRTETNRYPSGFDFDRRRREVLKSGLIGGVVLLELALPRNGSKDDGAHPPIYPAAAYRGGGIMGAVWEYVARRFIANAYMRDAVLVEQRAEIDLRGLSLEASGKYLEEEGFYALFHYFRPREERLPALSKGETVAVAEVRLVEDETRPPPRLSEAALLKVMEREGLGTDATRPIYPTLLVKRGYLTRAGKTLRPTPLGEMLIDALSEVDLRLVTPETRRAVENLMREIERQTITKEEALSRSIELYKPTLESCLKAGSRIGELLGKSITVTHENARSRRNTGRER